MPTLITDTELERRLLAERVATGADRYDEVWEGTTMMTPMPNDEHQQIVSRLISIFEEVIGWPGLGDIRPGVNISDRKDDWKQNYRVPDVAVFLAETAAENCGGFWYGGPDLVVEIISPGDETRNKLPFYESIRTREVLLIDRDPWQLELYRLRDDALRLAGMSALHQPGTLSSQVLPFTFALIAGESRPEIAVSHTAARKQWKV